jgi:hypothetical protein
VIVGIQVAVLTDFPLKLLIAKGTWSTACSTIAVREKTSVQRGAGVGPTSFFAIWSGQHQPNQLKKRFWVLTYHLI